jgi:hypothetical protein
MCPSLNFKGQKISKAYFSYRPGQRGREYFSAKAAYNKNKKTHYHGYMKVRY